MTNVVPIFHQPERYENVLCMEPAKHESCAPSGKAPWRYSKSNFKWYRLCAHHYNEENFPAIVRRIAAHRAAEQRARLNGGNR